MNLYQDGLGYLMQASSQVGSSPDNEVWGHLVAAQVCFNASIGMHTDAASYYARAETLEWMGLLSHDRKFFEFAIADLSEVIEREQGGARPSLLLNAFWFRSRLWQRISLERAIDDLTWAITLCPTELSFYLARAECQLKRGCPQACTDDLMAALWLLSGRENPLSQEAYCRLHTAMSLELKLVNRDSEDRFDRLAFVCATLREFWSNHQQYWFYLSRPQG